MFKYLVILKKEEQEMLNGILNTYSPYDGISDKEFKKECKLLEILKSKLVK